MRLEIREGYDIVVIAETEQDSVRLGKLNDKYQTCGLTVELIAGASTCFELIIKPEDPPDAADLPELGG